MMLAALGGFSGMGSAISVGSSKVRGLGSGAIWGLAGVVGARRRTYFDVSLEDLLELLGGL